jgi:calcium-dependent protein kinase
LHHPNIVRYYETYETMNFIYIIAELIGDGDLFDYIIRMQYLEEQEASLIMHQLLSTLIYLHNCGIIHRDLKPENILIVKKKGKDPQPEDHEEVEYIKLIDFGFAILMEEGEKLGEACGTPNYVAPEVYQGNYDKKSDIFSAGCIMYLMLRGLLPFDSVTTDIIVRKTMRGDYSMNDTHWMNISPEAQDLCKKLLEPNPDKRITLYEALAHPWITVS